MYQPDEIDTAKTILNNPNEVFNKTSRNYEFHQDNLKMLVYKNIIPIYNGEYLIQRSRINTFIDNNGKTQEELSLELAKESIKKAKISNSIALISVVIAIIALFK